MRFLCTQLPESIIDCEKQGEYTLAEQKIKGLLEKDVPTLLRERLKYELYRIKRIKTNYKYDEMAALKQLKKQIQGFTDQEFHKLVQEKRLDYVTIESKRYFEKRFADNLCFAEPAYNERQIPDKRREASKRLLHKRLNELLQGDSPKAYRVKGSVTKKLLKAPEGSKVVKCWLPLPKSDLQQRVSSEIKTSIRDFTVSRNNHPQRTLYTQRAYSTSEEISFSVEFEYRITEIISNVDPQQVTVPKLNMDAYLQEQLPHIVFTPYLKHLAHQIKGDEKNPYLIAKRIYDWITLNVRYSFMKEYKFYEDLSSYAAINLKGDCGVQALLFITLCRICDVPARWQSGWYANPLAPGNHDWAFFYCEPYGWLPVDCSFGGARRDREEYREFYFGNLDAFRMVTTTGFMAPFFPKKAFIRNDPYDNQTGEMETDMGPVEDEDTLCIKEIIEFEEITDKTEGKA
ncbi:MAG: transglutaminase-like domain-containing protein [Thermotogota bacterium]